MDISQAKIIKLKERLCLTPECCITHGKGHCYCENCKIIDKILEEQETNGTKHE